LTPRPYKCLAPFSSIYRITCVLSRSLAWFLMARISLVYRQIFRPNVTAIKMSRSILFHLSFNFYHSCQADYCHALSRSSTVFYMAWISLVSHSEFSYRMASLDVMEDFWITMLLIKHAHEQNQHAGTNQVLAQHLVQYWIISAREAIREWERERMQCRRRKPSPAKQMMAPLPELRTRKSLRAFSHISADLFSPNKEEARRVRRGTFVCSRAWRLGLFTSK